jgi:hypothetical protein
MLHRACLLQWEGMEEMSSSSEPLSPWLDAHSGEVSALDVNPSTHQVMLSDLALPPLATRYYGGRKGLFKSWAGAAANKNYK